MAQETKHLLDEADIGSGEKGAGQEDVERDERSINGTRSDAPLDGSQYQQVVEEQNYAHQRPGAPEQHSPEAAPASHAYSHVLQSGDHLARIRAAKQPDGTYEAQVYVRLTREPEIAETYIPAGTFPTESEAWMAAHQRATRAFKEHEF